MVKYKIEYLERPKFAPILGKVPDAINNEDNSSDSSEEILEQVKPLQ